MFDETLALKRQKVHRQRERKRGSRKFTERWRRKDHQTKIDIQKKTEKRRERKLEGLKRKRSLSTYALLADTNGAYRLAPLVVNELAIVLCAWLGGAFGAWRAGVFNGVGTALEGIDTGEDGEGRECDGGDLHGRGLPGRKGLVETR